jgi:ribokinase
MSSLDRRLNVGGKGLNQSIALARAGAEACSHAGAVGRRDGGILLDALKEAGVDVRHVAQLDACDSGNAFIQVGERAAKTASSSTAAPTRPIDETMIDTVLQRLSGRRLDRHPE